MKKLELLLQSGWKIELSRKNTKRFAPQAGTMLIQAVKCVAKKGKKKFTSGWVSVASFVDRDALNKAIEIVYLKVNSN